MNNETFRNWLVEQGCRIEGRQRQDRGEGAGSVHVLREGRTAELPLAGSHKAIDPQTARAICDALGLDASKLPGPASLH